MFSRLLLLTILLLPFFVYAEDEITIGDTPSAFLGNNADGDEVNLEAEQGKIVIVSFWSSKCAACLKELPILESVQRQLGDQVKVVAVNHKESGQNYRKMQKQLESFQLTLTHDKRGAISQQYGVTELPNIFVIGKDGKLAHHSQGYAEEEAGEVINVLNELLQSN